MSDQEKKKNSWTDFSISSDSVDHFFRVSKEHYVCRSWSPSIYWNVWSGTIYTDVLVVCSHGDLCDRRDYFCFWELRNSYQQQLPTLPYMMDTTSIRIAQDLQKVLAPMRLRKMISGSSLFYSLHLIDYWTVSIHTNPFKVDTRIKRIMSQ